MSPSVVCNLISISESEIDQKKESEEKIADEVTMENSTNHSIETKVTFDEMPEGREAIKDKVIDDKNASRPATTIGRNPRMLKNNKVMDDKMVCGSPTNSRNLPILSYQHGSGLPKTLCHFCKNEMTQVYCHQKSSTPWYIIDNKKVCGKPFCCKCAPVEDDRTRCRDCMVYTKDTLNAMSNIEVKALCNSRNIDYGKKQKKGCITLIIKDQQQNM